MRGLRIALAAALAAAAAAVPAWAITWGEPDGNDHPYVGALGILDPDGDPVYFCTGTLLAEDTLVTAAHCVSTGGALGGDPTDLFVTFDSETQPPATTFPVTDIEIPPFRRGFGHELDLAVVTLAGDTPETAAVLPPLGLLDTMRAAGAIADQAFVNVGYGLTQRTKVGPGAPTFERSTMRQVSTSSFSTLTKNWLYLSQNQARGDGGTCFGDSGGPQFLEDGDDVVLVSVTVTGDTQCVSRNIVLRLDTPEAQDFLGEFVDLP